MEPQYSVPIVYQDLRPEEALSQVFDALAQLNKTLDGVFGKIERRVALEQSRVDSLNSRIAVAHAKVAHIETSFAKKAIKVISPYKYPVAESVQKEHGYRPLYYDDGARMQAELEPATRANYNLAGVPQLPAASHFKNAVRQVVGLSEMHIVDEDTQDWEGLGRLPANLPSVSSLLLFNTMDNPYKVYVTLDNLEGVDFVDDGRDAAAELTEAPKTVAEGDALPELGKIEYGYRPTLGAVPTFDLPDQLPDLAMVAELAYDAPDLPDIAPSAESNLPALPDVDPAANDPLPPSIGDDAPMSLDPTSVDDAPPPPPPPASVVAAAPPAATPPAATGGAPPPPPPGVPPPPTAAPPSSAAPPPAAGERGGLLADIRKGRKLKSAKVARAPSKKAEEAAAKAPSSNPMDIMSALALALDRRRAGLGGKNAPKKTKKKAAKKSKKGAKGKGKKNQKKKKSKDPEPPSLPVSDDDDDDSDASDGDWDP
jgi:WAS protein family homolog 1